MAIIHNGKRQIKLIFCGILFLLVIRIEALDVRPQTYENREGRDRALSAVQQPIPMLNYSLAVLVAGARRNFSLQALESLKQYVGEPILGSGGRFDVFTCYDEKDAPETPEDCSRLHIRRNWTIRASSQAERLKLCFGLLSQSTPSGITTQYSHIMRTRPDLLWYGQVPMPFCENSIMVRARLISGVNVTQQHLSWKSCDPRRCKYSRCVTLDDQLAIVPKIWLDEYFMGTPSAHGSKADSDSTEDNNSLYFPLNERDVESCSYRSNTWAEGQLTLRLVELNVSVTISPFHVMLAPFPGKYRLRSPPENTTVKCM